MTKLGGRKFVLSVIGVLVIGVLAIGKADAAAFGSIALIVSAYNGANGYIEGRHAPRES
jgi:hypothetical protein